MNRKLFWISVIMGGTFIGTAFFAAVVVLKLPRLTKAQVFSPAATLAWSSKVGDGIAIPACGSASASVGCSGTTPILTMNWTDDTTICTSDSTQLVTIKIGETSSTMRNVDTIPCTQTSYTWSGGSLGTTYFYQPYYATQLHAIVLPQPAPALPSYCAPPPTLTIAPSSASIIRGNTEQFTATYDSDGSGPISPTDITASASWSSSNTGIATVSGGLATSIAAGGPITITATSNGLTANASLTVTAPPLTASAQVNPSSGTSGITVFSFTGSQSGGTGPYSYAWNFGDGDISSAQNPTHIYATDGTYTAKLTVTDSGSPILTAVSSVSVSVAIPVPDISMSLIPPSAFIAFGSSVTISWTILHVDSSKNDFCTYTSNPSDPTWNSKTSTTNGSYLVTPPATVTYTITCKNGGGTASASTKIISAVIRESGS